MLEKAVATAIAAVAPRNATAWFRHCGYLLSDTATPEPPTMISMSNSLALQGGRAPHQQVRVRLHPTGLPRLFCMRAGLDDLPVIESQLPHPPQAHRQLAGNGHKWQWSGSSSSSAADNAVASAARIAPRHALPPPVTAIPVDKRCDCCSQLGLFFLQHFAPRCQRPRGGHVPRQALANSAVWVPR